MFELNVYITLWPSGLYICFHGLHESHTNKLISSSSSLNPMLVLQLHGKENVSVLDGGLEKWLADDLPTVQDAPVFLVLVIVLNTAIRNTYRIEPSGIVLVFYCNSEYVHDVCC